MHWRGETPSGATLALRRHPRESTRADAENELRVLELLHAHGIPVPEPVPADDGAFVVDDEGTWSACVWIDGRPPDRDDAEVAAGLGRVLAEVHAIPESAGGGPSAALAQYADAVRWGGYTLRSAVEKLRASEPAASTAVAECVSAVARHLDAVRPPPRRSLVHGDVHPLNVLVGDRGIAVLDWAFARWDDPLVDLAIAFRLWPEAFPSLLAAYREVRPVTEGEASSIPVFAAARGLDHLADRLTRWATGMDVDIAAELEAELPDLRRRLPALG